MSHVSVISTTRIEPAADLRLSPLRLRTRTGRTLAIACRRAFVSPPSGLLTPDFTFDYYRQNYDNPNFFSTDPTNPALGGRTVRRDDIYMDTAGLSRPITQHLFLSVQYSYTRDKANISLFNYERMVYSITLSGSF